MFAKTIQRTVKLGQAVDTGLAKKLSTDEFYTLKLIANWQEIAQTFAEICIPTRLYTYQATLILSAKPGYSMTLQYQTAHIIQIVNLFFNKKLIEKIMVKTQIV